MNNEKVVDDNKVVSHHHKSQGLSAIWEDRTGSTITNPKQHKQLKRLKEALGMERATQLIDYILPHWSEFGSKYTDNNPNAPYPAEPQIGFLTKYHALALVTLTEMQSLARQKAKEEQARKEALAKAKNEAATVKSPPTMTILECTPAQLAVYLNPDHELNSAFLDAVTAKYGKLWRPAKWDEDGIPCEVDFKLAA